MLVSALLTLALVLRRRVDCGVCFDEVSESETVGSAVNVTVDCGGVMQDFSEEKSEFLDDLGAAFGNIDFQLREHRR